MSWRVLTLSLFKIEIKCILCCILNCIELKYHVLLLFYRLSIELKVCCLLHFSKKTVKIISFWEVRLFLWSNYGLHLLINFDLALDKIKCLRSVWLCLYIECFDVVFKCLSERIPLYRLSLHLLHSSEII